MREIELLLEPVFDYWGGNILSIKDNEKNFKICMQFCGNCPSYSHNDGEGLYCVRGASKSWIEKEGCLCSSCPIFEMYKLSETYFCTKRKDTHGKNKSSVS